MKFGWGLEWRWPAHMLRTSISDSRLGRCLDRTCCYCHQISRVATPLHPPPSLFEAPPTVRAILPSSFPPSSMLRQVAQKLGKAAGPAFLTTSPAWASAGLVGACRSLQGGVPVRAPLHIEEETHCRQRNVIVLEDKMPFICPDAWVAPNAVVVGDVDLSDGVSAGQPACVCTLSHEVALPVIWPAPYGGCPQITPLEFSGTPHRTHRL